MSNTEFHESCREVFRWLDVPVEFNKDFFRRSDESIGSFLACVSMNLTGNVKSAYEHGVKNFDLIRSTNSDSVESNRAKLLAAAKAVVKAIEGELL